MKMILFIAEKNILTSSICYNNDVNLLIELLKENKNIYLANPQDIILSNEKSSIEVNLILINDLLAIEKIKKLSYLKYALFILFSLPLTKEFKEKNIITDFLTIKKIKINKSDINIVIDRAEPISRTKEYYQSICNLNYKKYFDDPIFRQQNGDKEIVLKIDQELKIKQQNNLGFQTMILDFSDENKLLENKNRHKLFDILQNLDQNNLEFIIEEVLNKFKNINQQEQDAIIKIIKKIYNCNINFDYFCLKPANWYGGVAVELIGNKKQKIKSKFSKKDLFYYIAKIHKNILKDVKKTTQDQELILQNAVLSGVIIQEQVFYPEFGDIRVFVSFGQIQGVILRVPDKNNNIANMSAGGYAEIFINPIGKKKEELKILHCQLQEIGQSDIFDAMMNLIENIHNSLTTKIGENLKKSAFIGFDALLDKNEGKKYFSCNEINLSSAMGQNQIEIANILEELLKNSNFCSLLLKNTYKLLKINDILPYEDKIKLDIFPFVKFLLFKKLTTKLNYLEKIKIIDELYLQIKDIKFNISSISYHTIKKIING